MASMNQVPDADPQRPVAATAAADFATRFEQVAPALLAWAHLRVRPGLRASIEPEDLVQEVGCRAFARAQDFDPARATFRQWLFGFANRVLLEALRELGKRPGAALRRTGGDTVLGEVAAQVTTISRRVARDDSLRRFLLRLGELPAEDHSLLVHHGLEGLAFAEVGKLLGIEEATARKRWQRLGERLRADPVFAALAE